MTVINDANGTAMKVTDEGRAHTYAVTECEQLHANEHHGVMYCATISRTPTGAGDVFFYMKNNDDDDMVVARIDVYAASAESVQIKVKDTGTPSGGTDLTPANLNAGSGNAAEVTAQDGVDITALSGGVTLCELFGSTTMEQHELIGGVILPKNKIFTLYAVTGAVALKVNVWFYFHAWDN